eukprot:5864505-Amphidinium_carterae.2
MVAAFASEDKWNTHIKKISGWDTWFCIDLALLKVMSGAAGQRKVQTSILAVLPDAGSPKSIDIAVEELKTMERSDLCRYAGSQSKGDLAATLELLNQIKCSIMPARVASPSPFMLSLWSRLPFFATVEVEAKGGKEEEKKILMGQVAIDHLWETLQSTPEADVTQRQVDSLGVWAYLLSKEAQEQLHAMSLKVLNARQVTPAKRQLRKGEEKTSKKSKAQAHEPENQTAMAFLGIK